MFAEELSGNSQRKKQEEARARRRQLKQSQQRKKNVSTLAGGGASSTTGSSSSTSPDKTANVSLAAGKSPLSAPTTLVEDTTPSTVENGSNRTTAKAAAPSAVAVALEQRKLRAQQKLRLTSVAKIQALYRAYRSNRNVKESQQQLMDQRLGDLITLRKIIKDAKGLSYVAPPATATAMVIPILFLTKSTPYQREKDADGVCRRRQNVLRVSYDNLARVVKILDNVLMPGLVCEQQDEHLDPILPWLSSFQGKQRFKNLLRLCLHCLVMFTDESETDVIVTFLRALLDTRGLKDTARKEVVAFVRSSVLTFHPTQLDKGEESVAGRHRLAVCVKTLDLIAVLRSTLLFQTGGPNPIPADADKLREACIPQKERERADKLFRLTLDAILCPSPEKRNLQSRFLEEVFTVPLLTWRISPRSLSMIVNEDSDDSRKTPILLQMIDQFSQQHMDPLRRGMIDTYLPSKDTPLTLCPATNVQCLLANLVLCGRVCSSINETNAPNLDCKSAALFFNFLATLVDLIPLGTFASRLSAVEWVKIDARYIPIVLSPVIMDQCRMILVDSYVRELFLVAIRNDALDVDEVLKSKNEKDLKHEKDMQEVGAASASALAAKEAMVDRKKGFWQSKWAKNLKKTMTSLLSGDGHANNSSSLIEPKGKGRLVNTSAVSRELASGAVTTSHAVGSALATPKNKVAKASKTSKTHCSIDFLFALCRVYGTVLARWGGGGRDDVVKRGSSSEATEPENDVKGGHESSSKERATTSSEPCTLSLLNVICFSTTLLQTLWAIIQSDKRVIEELYALLDRGKNEAPIRLLKVDPFNAVFADPSKAESQGTGSVLLFMFVCCLSHVLIVTDDVEIHEMEKPLPLHQLRRCVMLLKKLLHRACCADDTAGGQVARTLPGNYFGLSLISMSARTMRDLYDRSSRRPLCTPKVWIVNDLLEKEIRRCKSYDDFISLLSLPVLRVCPFLVSFKRRLKIFERIVTTNRVLTQGSNEQHNLQPGIIVKIHRSRVLEDGLLHMNKLGPNMRRRLVVQYINEAGEQELGVDVGGLFKEFWSDLGKMAFDPNFALFCTTEDNCMYPNPASGTAHGSDHVILFEFLGRILGKALYEGVTIQPQFAHFFLSFIRGDYNFLHMLPDLSTMDAQLYNNLMFLKTYEGDAKDLCLTFTVANDDFGGNKEVSLIPNGADFEVTNANKQRYIGLMAKYHVCDRVKEQSQAFTRGLWEVIDRQWLRLFNEPELQVLISGATDGKIDVADMRAHTRYAGGYSGLDRNVHRFWNVMSSLSSKQQADLLRFVTSCERAPPLGFASMNPPFTIQRVGIMRDGDKLPTASTCFNTLKLPTYSSEKVLRERLIYAIESGAGFELS